MPRHVVSKLIALVGLFLCASMAHAQCVSLTTPGSAYTQNFDTLSNVAGSTTNNLTITGWFMTEAGGGARDNEQYSVDTGASTTGDTVSYGAAGSTERALGGLRSGTLIPSFGACFTNNTGATLGSLAIAYNGEEWRLGTAGRTDSMTFEYSLDATSLITGTWTGVSALTFVTPDTATVGAKNGNAAADRTALSSSVTGLSIANGATFWIRFNDTDATGADDGLAVDDFSLTPTAALPTPSISINDVTLDEGNAGTTNFTFTVSLSVPAGPGGVTFNIATADGTAQDDNPATEDNDYVAKSLTAQTIPAGSSTYSFTVLVNGDTVVEPNETFFVNLTGIAGATAGDVQGLGTITNDDVAITPIHDIQGPGNASPIVGSTVTTRGIVTGVKSNGFFIQESDAGVDADPATSEGIFVFTSSAPPAAAAFSSRVQVTGTVTEFVPTSDPLQPPVTELTSPTVTQLAPAGQALPTAVPLTSSFPSPAGPYDQLERLEGMRVLVASFTVSGPSDGSVNEPNATGTSNGRFHGVITGVARPFREPGVEAPNPVPAGTIPPIPRWDANPERLRVESATINSQPALTVKTGDVVGPFNGPLDYAFRGYAVYPDGTLTPNVTPGTLQTTVTAPAGSEFTVASYNLQHFYDTVNDPAIGEPVLTAAAFDNRLAKASIAIRNHLRMPDILGVQEVENLATLQALAARISADALAASQPDPQYTAYLFEGNDVGGIDVGFLVKTAPVGGPAPRVTVNAVTQVGLAATWIDPSTGSSDLLNDRPPLVLDATVSRVQGASFNVVVVNNHLRSLIDIESQVAAGPTTLGDRVRQKRQAQAVFLANYLQGRLATTPNEHIVVIGDMNAFEFNDGYADTIGTIMGTPSPDNQTVVAGDGADLVNPDFANLVNTPPALERYSYVHDGNAQNIDHALASAGLVADTAARRIEHPRIGADYPETERNDATNGLRVSDHDPVVAYFQVPGFTVADLALTQSDSPDPVIAGSNLTYTITLAQNGPDAAGNVSLVDTLPAGTTFVSLSAQAGWSCTTPAVGAGGTVTCAAASLATGTSTFQLIAHVDTSNAQGTVLSNTATVSASTADPVPGNNQATATTSVLERADLSVTNVPASPNANAGGTVQFDVGANNAGPSNANASFTTTLPAGTTFASLNAASGWNCTTPAVGAAGTVSCTISTFAPGSAAFNLVLAIDPAYAPGALADTVTISSSTTDPTPGNNLATASVNVTAAADVSIANTPVSPTATAGGNASFTLTVTNAGPSAAANTQVENVISPGTTIVSFSSAAGWNCTAPPLGTGTLSCSIASFAPGSASFTLTLGVDAAFAPGTLADTATVSSTTDTSTGNDSATANVTIVGSADLGVMLAGASPFVTAGTDTQFTLTASNAGPSAASAVQVGGSLPGGTTFVSLSAPAGWSCTTPAVGAAGAISCTAATFAAGGNATFDLVMNVDPAFDVSGTGTTMTISSATTDSNPANNSATTGFSVQMSADIAASIVAGSATANAGGNAQFTITGTNAGPSTARSVQVRNPLPAGTTFVSLTAPSGWNCTTPAVGGTGNARCETPVFAPGASATFVLTIAIDAGFAPGTLSNGVIIEDMTPDPVTGNDIATATVSVGGSADLSVTNLPAPPTLDAGNNVQYAITMLNAGPSAAVTAQLANILPTGTTFVSLASPAGWSCATPLAGGTGTVSCSLGNFPPGSAAFTLTLAVDSDYVPGPLADTATVTSATSDPDAGNNGATANVTVGASADLAITNTASTPTAINGQPITYTIVVTDNGPSDASNLTLTSAIPAGTTFTSLTSAAGWSCTTPAAGATGTVSCTHPALARGASATFGLTVTVNDGLPPSTVVSTATVTSSTSDPTPANASASASTTTPVSLQSFGVE